MNVKDIRRNNLRLLSEEIGGVTKLAEFLGRSQSQISHLIGNNPIKNVGDRLAAHIEEKFNKEKGWLDHEHLNVAEENGNYFLNSDYYLNTNWVPLISWTELNSYLDNPFDFKASTTLPVEKSLGHNLLAIKLNNNSQEFHGLFPEQSVLIVDQHYNNPNQQFAVIINGNQKPFNPQLCYIVSHGNKIEYYADKAATKPLQINESARILAVVKRYHLDT